MLAACEGFCMTGSGRAVLRALGAIALAGWLAGCEELKPYRTQHAPAARNCNADPAFMVPEHCRASMVESSDDYDLFFTEYTDQGLAYPEGFGEAHRQIDRTIEGLTRIGSANRGVSVLVFVHGWKHNASHDDDNVREFRALLRSAALFERARTSGKRVVGVFVGWRGLSIADEPLSNLSFWSRKAAALRVAQGSPRELFNRLRSFKCAQNLNAHELRRAPDQPAECADWRPLRGIADPEERRRQAEVNRRAEEANINRFPGRNRALGDNWTRTFCGGAQLAHMRHKPNSVIWNVQTDASIMKGHNDISNDALFEFVRQLYHDTVLYPLPAGSNVRPQAAPERK
jgi:hypothetical protein